MKRTKHDDIFSKLVRERAGQCEYCGKQGRLECSHFYGRRNTQNGLRWHPLNAAALCHSCHRHMTENPAEHVAWYESLIGCGAMEILREKYRGSIFRFTDRDREEMYQHYKSEYKKMMQKRADGVTGRISFDAYD